MVAPARLEARKARLFALFNSPKERLKSQVHAFDHILKHLRGDRGDIWTNFFACGQFSALIFIREGDTGQTIRTCAFIERGIIGFAAQNQPLLQRALLLVGGFSRFDIRLLLASRCFPQGNSLQQYPLACQEHLFHIHTSPLAHPQTRKAAFIPMTEASGAFSGCVG